MWLENALNGNGLNPASWPNFAYLNSMISATPRPGQPRPEPKLLEGQPMVVYGMPTGTNEKEIVNLTSDDLLKRAGMRMPVYACGYNWLESNDNAADWLRDRIRHVIAEESKRGTCNQVLLVTHSMGGLVARRCAQLSGMADAIAGIVHGVMPATGAAVAYRRCKIGMADEDFSAGLVIGSNGRETTAVFAQAPGALQLLPTEQYRSGWLQIKDGGGRRIHSTPKSDPYSEIYLRRDRWWGLVRAEWLSPAGGEPISWEDYVDNIAEARSFHSLIRGSYHSNTHVYYGADEGVPSYETVRWTMKHGVSPTGGGSPPTAEQVCDMGSQEVTDDGRNPLYVGLKIKLYPKEKSYENVSHWELWAEQQDGDGDGTVPASSGQSPLKHAAKSGDIRQQYRLVGFEHEESYRNNGAQLVSLNCINKIAAEAWFSS